jgi:hypothetical protein
VEGRRGTALDCTLSLKGPIRWKAADQSTSGVNAWRSDVVGIFPNEDIILRLVGALPLEQNGEWAVQRGYMKREKTSIRSVGRCQTIV